MRLSIKMSLLKGTIINLESFYAMYIYMASCGWIFFTLEDMFKGHLTIGNIYFEKAIWLW